MTDVLVVNHRLSEVCGVHDLGRRLHDAIPDSIDSGYCELWSAASLIEAVESHKPAVVLVNFRADLMPWVSEALGHVRALRVAVAHNYEPHTLLSLHGQHTMHGFDVTLALEPQLADVPGVVWSGRPLPPPLRAAIPAGRRPWIGSFGFAFGHKGFATVATEIVEQITPPVVYRLHCPTAYFGGSQGQTAAVIDAARAALEAAPVNGYHLDVTTDHRPATSVVRILAECDVNCLLYEPGQPDAGLSSALDYLLAAGRPILVSQASMFRHAVPAALTWPEHRLGDVLADADRHAVNVRERYDQLSAGYAGGIKQLLEMA